MAKTSGLRLWDGARELAEDVLEQCRRFPKDDPSDLRRQLARSADSIAANIAEGLGRGTRGEKLYFLRISSGSLEETKTRLRSSVNAEYIDRKTFFRLWNRSVALGRMLAAYKAGVERTRETERADLRKRRDPESSGPAKPAERRERRPPRRTR